MWAIVQPSPHLSFELHIPITILVDAVPLSGQPELREAAHFPESCDERDDVYHRRDAATGAA